MTISRHTHSSIYTGLKWIGVHTKSSALSRQIKVVVSHGRRKADAIMPAKGVNHIDGLIGQNIRATRLNRGVSQKELGAQIGVTFQQIQKYERGTNAARGSRLVQIARALNIAVVALFEGTEAGCLPIHSELPSLIVNHHALRMLRAFSKLKGASSQQALVTLAEELIGKQ